MSDDNFLQNINPEDVASVSSSGVTVNFRSLAEKHAAQKAKLEAEEAARAAKFNPFDFLSGDRSFRR